MVLDNQKLFTILSNMKKNISISGNTWTIDTTEYGADIFLAGGSVATVGGNTKNGHAYWMKRAAIWIAENNHRFIS